MVAWELALIEEKAERTDEAGRWYTIAAQRFRRAEWKKKAEEALTKLGIALPAPGDQTASEPGVLEREVMEPVSLPQALEEVPHIAGAEPRTHTSESEPPVGLTGSAEAGEGGRKKRRRGRRGGRGRRRKGAAAQPGLPSQAFAELSAAPPREHQSRPQVAPLEPPVRTLSPAGPGVFLLSDSDQISSYYVEACQTLRVAIGNLGRGGRGGGGSKGNRGGRGGYSSDSGLKAKLAEHLEISEAKVGQYLKDHCVVRWIQLDDDAQLLSHFAIAVLRTPLNMD
jgi:hypothetical protein